MNHHHAPPDENTSSQELSELVADTVLKHPSVVRLDGGQMGLVATHLPGRKVLGVRLVAGQPVEISVVLVMGSRVPEVSAALRASVRELVGDVPIHIAITDLVESADS